MDHTQRARPTNLTVGVVDRARLRDITINDVTIHAADITARLDAHHVPDGTPFLADPLGRFHTVEHVNAYLLDAAKQRAYPLSTLRGNHAGPFARLVRHTRTRRPDADLTDTTRDDLTSYRELRRETLQGSSWNSELSTISNFYRYARVHGWMPVDPIPRWGTNQRNTLKSPERVKRRIRFLTEPQLRYFLEHGLRGDDTPEDSRPEYPERDYAYGLTLASTGLRREEANYLLDIEIPTRMPPGAVHIFERYGKGGKPRDVHILDLHANAIDHYRRSEREYLVHRAQPTLRARRRNDTLTIADVITTRTGTRFIIDGARIKPSLLSNKRRRDIVRVRDDGTLDPLALFVVEGGRGPATDRFNRLFTDANDRIALLGHHPDAPPPHLGVTPHVLRHTFAVRTLASLMRHGRDTTGDPYALLANPVLVVQELLGHADLATTHEYLYLAERYTDQVPNALRNNFIKLVEGL